MLVQLWLIPRSMLVVGSKYFFGKKTPGPQESKKTQLLVSLTCTFKELAYDGERELSNRSK